jgi:ubiquinone/menaquinone biosynthesis C-methylase UbiE
LKPRQTKLSDRTADLIALYGRRPSEADLAVERDVYGINAGIVSYTTPAQAEELAEALDVGPGRRLLEIGAGSGWPGVFLVNHTGCHATLTDVPVPAIRAAAWRGRKDGAIGRLSFAVASATNLPFQPKSFDAVVHSDVL